MGRRNPAWADRYLAAMVGADALTGALAVLLAWSLTWDTGHALAPSALVAAVVWPLAVLASQGYRRAQFGVGSEEFRAVFAAMVKVIVVAAFYVAFFQNGTVMAALGLAALIATPVSLAARFVARKVLHRQQAQGSLLREVVAVGHLEDVKALNEIFRAEPHCGLRLVGACLPRGEHEEALQTDIAVLGDLDDAAEVAQARDAHAVAVTNRVPSHYLRQLSWELENSSTDILVHPGLMEVAGPRMHIRPHVGLPLLAIEQPHFFGWRRLVKRAFDLTCTTFGLLAISPALIAIALLVKLGDGGPIFFRQTRVGLNGETFKMIKFRSMVVDAEARLAALEQQNEGSGPLFKLKRDPRITRVGGFLRRYSLDELPQLFNVLSGEMSLVGPRPPLESEVANYHTDTHRRLLVQPGLTGLWQVSGRSLLTWEESVRLDLRYVENWSLSLDFLILWKTLGAVVGKTGAY